MKIKRIIMKNLLYVLVFFVIKNINAQSTINNNKFVLQEKIGARITEDSSQIKEILRAVITKDIPVTNPNSVASLYPNPIVDQATIELDRLYKEVVVSIADVSGTIVQIASFSDIKRIQFEVDVPKGVYTMTAVDEDNTNLLGNLFIKK